MRLGGLGLVNPSTTSDLDFQASEKLTAPLVAIVSSQDQIREIDQADIITMKKDLKTSNRQRNEEESNIIYRQLMLQMKRQVELAKERGHRPGSQCCLSWNRVSFYTKESSEMPYAYVTAGLFRIHQTSTTVAKLFPQIMPWCVTWVDFLQSTKMRSGI